jgi:outer membrane protein assembly factor BamB
LHSEDIHLIISLKMRIAALDFSHVSPIGRMVKVIHLIALLLPGITASAEPAPNWPHWRGPRDNGSTESGSYPVHWDNDKQLLWKITLPGKGCSTPIVWDRQIFLTAPIESQDGLLAFDWSGKRIWQQTFGPEKSGKNVHGSGSNPSPASDGNSVFVFFKSGHFAAVDLKGMIRWQTDLVERFGRDTLYWDFGTSPVLTEQDVIIARLHHGDSYVAAFNKATGALHWKVSRNYETAIEGDHSYATPLVARLQGRETVLILGGEHLTAQDASTGKLLWACGDFNPQRKKNWVPVASPVVAGDMAIIPYGRGSALHGIRLGESADAGASRRTWLRDDTGSFVSTPAEYRGRIYLLHDQGPQRGIVECIDPANGKSLWRGELPKSSAEYYTSPTVGDGKLYAAREDGVVFVAKIDGGFELLGQAEMGEQIIASPVLIEGRILLRGETHLFCAGKE